MTRVDFYLVGGTGTGTGSEPTAGADKYLAACKLIHKIFRLGHRVYLLTQDAREAETLDQLLWTFAAGSFVPHRRTTETLDPRVPIVIGPEPPPEPFNDVMVSLAAEVSPYYERFQRVADIVGADPADKERGRARFRFYRDRGCPLETHTL